jgi:hypothetical protein
MTPADPVPLAGPAPLTGPVTTAGGAPDGDDPWAGIPAELLDGSHGYDTDTPGGCG